MASDCPGLNRLRRERGHASDFDPKAPKPSREEMLKNISNFVDDFNDVVFNGIRPKGKE